MLLEDLFFLFELFGFYGQLYTYFLGKSECILKSDAPAPQTKKSLD